MGEISLAAWADALLDQLNDFLVVCHLYQFTP
jgi:hypothetical protein